MSDETGETIPAVGVIGVLDGMTVDNGERVVFKLRIQQTQPPDGFQDYPFVMPHRYVQPLVTNLINLGRAAEQARARSKPEPGASPTTASAAGSSSRSNPSASPPPTKSTAGTSSSLESKANSAARPTSLKPTARGSRTCATRSTATSPRCPRCTEPRSLKIFPPLLEKRDRGCHYRHHLSLPRQRVTGKKFCAAGEKPIPRGTSAWSIPVGNK